MGNINANYNVTSRNQQFNSNKENDKLIQFN